MEEQLKDLVTVFPYIGVSALLFVLSYWIADLLIPGKLGDLLCVERNRNAGAVLGAFLIGTSAIITTAIAVSDNDLGKGLVDVALFGFVGILAQAVFFVILDLLTPNKLGKILHGDEHEPIIYAIVAGNLGAAALICASIA